ncbi:hypothetical protein [Providencia rettgeri]
MSSKINGYINDVVNFKGINSIKFKLEKSSVKNKTIELAIP